MKKITNQFNMSYMFDNCYELSSLDLSKFNTENVTNMKYMFDNCWELSSLDLSNFNTAKVEDMSYMFSDCWELSSLDLSNFYTAKVLPLINILNGKYRLFIVEAHCRLASLNSSSIPVRT
jgi:surface protein